MLIAQLQPSCLYGGVRPQVGRFRACRTLVSPSSMWEYRHLVIRSHRESYATGFICILDRPAFIAARSFTFSTALIVKPSSAAPVYHITSHPMPPRRTLPQELVDKIIDELGDAYRDPDHARLSNRRINACQTLHTCALVSKNWTGRSRAHLFRGIRIRVDKDGLVYLIPPQSLMPHIKKLRIQLWCRNNRVYSSPDLLIPFYTAPIAYLGFAGGIFDAETRACLAECITALSATLQTVVFKSCTLPLRIITDILLAHSDLKHLYLHSCILKPASGGPLVPPRLSERPGASARELGVFSRPLTGGHGSTVAAVAQLGSQFSSLNLDYIYGPGSTYATNTLLKASAASLSSLTVHIRSCTSKITAEKHPLIFIGICRSDVLAIGGPNAVQPGRLFQPIGTDFEHGVYDFVPHSNLYQYSLNPRSNTTQSPGVGRTDDGVCLPMALQEIPG